MRLDQELVRRRLMPSRSAARRAIVEGRVTVAGVAGPRPATQVGDHTPLTVDPEATRYVGRGGHKLAAALDTFGIDPRGRDCLDVGASTGGFADCLLQRGAGRVVAVDVGTGQIHPSLHTDPRLESLEGSDIRRLRPESVGGPFDLVVVDVSFVSQRLLTEVLASFVKPNGDLISLIKPQFEVGRDGRRKDGVVDDERRQAAAVESVLGSFSDVGLVIRARMPSPLPGRAGNVEHLAWLRHSDQDGHRG